MKKFLKIVILFSLIYNAEISCNAVSVSPVISVLFGTTSALPSSPRVPSQPPRGAGAGRPCVPGVPSVQCLCTAAPTLSLSLVTALYLATKVPEDQRPWYTVYAPSLRQIQNSNLPVTVSS